MNIAAIPTDKTGGKFVKKKDLIPLQGVEYECIENVIMPDYTAFTVGKTYLSQCDGYLTNNKGNNRHGLSSEFFELHFKSLS